MYSAKKVLALTSVLSLAVLHVGCSNKSQVQSSSDTMTSSTTNSATTSSPRTTDTSTTTPAQMMRADTSTSIAAAFDAKKVSLSNLPSTVRPFVQKHYAGYTIASAAYDPLCGGAPAIDVSIRKSGQPNLSVIFLPNGDYVQKEQDVPMSTAPATVTASLKKEFPGYRADNQIEQLTLADGTVEWSFDVAKGSVKREIILSDAGAIVCDTKE